MKVEIKNLFINNKTSVLTIWDKSKKYKERKGKFRKANLDTPFFENEVASVKVEYANIIKYKSGTIGTKDLLTKSLYLNDLNFDMASNIYKWLSTGENIPLTVVADVDIYGETYTQNPNQTNTKKFIKQETDNQINLSKNVKIVIKKVYEVKQQENENFDELLDLAISLKSSTQEERLKAQSTLKAAAFNFSTEVKAIDNKDTYIVPGRTLKTFTLRETGKSIKLTPDAKWPAKEIEKDLEDGKELIVVRIDKDHDLSDKEIEFIGKVLSSISYKHRDKFFEVDMNELYKHEQELRTKLESNPGKLELIKNHLNVEILRTIKTWGTYSNTTKQDDFKVILVPTVYPPKEQSNDFPKKNDFAIYVKPDKITKPEIEIQDIDWGDDTFDESDEEDFI